MGPVKMWREKCRINMRVMEKGLGKKGIMHQARIPMPTELSHYFQFTYIELTR